MLTLGDQFYSQTHDMFFIHSSLNFLCLSRFSALVIQVLHFSLVYFSYCSIYFIVKIGNFSPLYFLSWLFLAWSKATTFCIFTLCFNLKNLRAGVTNYLHKINLYKAPTEQHSSLSSEYSMKNCKNTLSQLNIVTFTYISPNTTFILK